MKITKNKNPVTPDRISVYFGRKIMLKQYEPVDINVGYTSDVSDGESLEEAYKRISNFVKLHVKNESIEIVKLKNKKGDV
jgi:acyl-ACP thioesterase